MGLKISRLSSTFCFYSRKPSSKSGYGKGNTGNNVPTGADGWTTRFMWCDYIESKKQKSSCGWDGIFIY
jgi:hypothetical protein